MGRANSDGEPAIEAGEHAYRERAPAFGIPVFDERDDTAPALVALRTVEQHQLNVSLGNLPQSR